MEDQKAPATPNSPTIPPSPPPPITPPPIVVKTTKPRPPLATSTASQQILSPEESRAKAAELERGQKAAGALQVSEISPIDRRKLGRQGVRIYLSIIELMDPEVAAAKERDKGWMGDAEECLADILVEDFGIKDLKEARWILGGTIFIPPAIKAYKGMKAKSKGAEHERRQEKGTPGQGQGHDPGAGKGV